VEGAETEEGVVGCKFELRVCVTEGLSWCHSPVTLIFSSEVGFQSAGGGPTTKGNLTIVGDIMGKMWYNVVDTTSCSLSRCRSKVQGVYR
jgi:hypothetical protein